VHIGAFIRPRDHPQIPRTRLPVKYGADLLDRVLKLGAEFVARVRAEIADLFPDV
jgi:hypothetical protein